ncbi:hypothetical protein JL991_19235 [Acinetobacter baumannii]|nr:hypothetical protein [Acinetobacter baumannii]
MKRLAIIAVDTYMRLTVSADQAATTFINGFYDPPLGLYQDVNQDFGMFWRQRLGQNYGFK